MKAFLTKIKTYHIIAKNTSFRWLLSSLITRRIRAHLCNDASQAGELTAIRKLVKDGDPPYLVDIGAHDGSSVSNSSFFVEAGWKAILIEPAPGAYQRLSARYKGYPNVTCLNVACSEKPGIEDFFIGIDGPGGMLGTLCTDDNEWFAITRSNQSIKVVVETLTQVLLRSGFPNDFTLLLIDTEGMDYECLLGLDFSQFSPRIIVTEEYKLNESKNHSKHKLLKDQGYRQSKEVGCNTVWIREKNRTTGSKSDM